MKIFIKSKKKINNIGLLDVGIGALFEVECEANTLKRPLAFNNELRDYPYAIFIYNDKIYNVIRGKYLVYLKDSTDNIKENIQNLLIIKNEYIKEDILYMNNLIKLMEKYK